MAITTTTFLQDITLLIRGFLVSGCVDPLTATRSSASKFVLTANPTRNVEWPVIVVKSGNITTRKLGLASEQVLANTPFEVRIWARTQKEKDSLTQQAINALRTRQTGSGESIANELFGFNIMSANDVDEFDGGMQGIKSKILNVSYSVILSE